MKPEEKELLAMHQEIEEELEENRYLARRIRRMPDDTLTVRVPKRKIKNPPVAKKADGPPKKKKKKKMKRKRSSIEDETEVEAVEDEDDSARIGVSNAFDDSEIDLTEDPWNNLEVPWKNIPSEKRIERLKKTSGEIDGLGIDQMMERYTELVVLGKGGRNVGATVKDEAIMDFFYAQRAKVGLMLGSYADKKRDETLAICDFVSTLGTKILEFEVKPNGAQAQCFFGNVKLKKADAWVFTATMEIKDEDGRKTISVSKKYVHKKLVPLLQAVLFVVGFDVTVTGTIEDFVKDLDSSLSLDEKVTLVKRSGMSKDFAKGLAYSINKVTKSAEQMEGFMDERWTTY